MRTARRRDQLPRRAAGPRAVPGAARAAVHPGHRALRRRGRGRRRCHAGWRWATGWSARRSACSPSTRRCRQRCRAPAPPSLDDAEAAGLTVAYQTAWFGLHRRAGLQRGGVAARARRRRGCRAAPRCSSGSPPAARVIAVVGQRREGGDRHAPRARRSCSSAARETSRPRCARRPAGAASTSSSTPWAATPSRVDAAASPSRAASSWSASPAARSRTCPRGTPSSRTTACSDCTGRLYHERMPDARRRGARRAGAARGIRARSRPVVGGVVPFDEAPRAVQQLAGGATVGRLVVIGAVVTRARRAGRPRHGRRARASARRTCGRSTPRGRASSSPTCSTSGPRSPRSSGSARCTCRSTSRTRMRGTRAVAADARGLRVGRRARQQRRHRQRRADRALHAREVERRHRGQPHRGLPRLPRRGAGDEGAGAAARSSTSRRSRGCAAAPACTATPRRSSGCAGSRSRLAVELGPSGIRVNSVHPGLILTDMTTRIDPARMDIPLGRPGTPADVAGTVVFLASDASRVHERRRVRRRRRHDRGHPAPLSRPARPTAARHPERPADPGAARTALTSPSECRVLRMMCARRAEARDILRSR